MVVVLSPRAQRERDAIHRRIARQSGAARANETVGKIMQSINLLEQHPDMGRNLEGGDQLLAVPGTYYVVVYHHHPRLETVRVKRLVDGRRIVDALTRR